MSTMHTIYIYKKTAWLIGFTVALTMAAGAAFAADSPTGDKTTSKTETKTAEAEKSAPKAAERLLTLDYVNAEVTDVIRALSAQSGVNVALNPTVKGQITVHLRGKTVGEAMSMVANLAGLGAKRVNDTFVVAPRAEMRPTLERLGISRSFALVHLAPQAAVDLAQNAFPDLTARTQGKGVVLIGAGEDLDEAERLLRQNDRVAPEEVHTVERVEIRNIPVAQAAAAVAKMEPGLSADAAGGSVVLSGTKAQVEGGKRGLQLIDVKSPPNYETRVYNIRYAAASQLIGLLERTMPDVQVYPGPESQTLPKPAFNPLTGQFAGGGAAGSAGPLPTYGQTQTLPSGSTGPGGNGAPTNAPGMVIGNALSLLLKGTPDALNEAMKVLALTDTPPLQVTIEAKVVETSPSLIEDIGVKYSWDPLQFIEGKSGTGVPAGSYNAVTKPNGIGVFSRVPWSFTGVLNAMITDRTAKLLANPSVTVINDQDASIFIGDTLRFQSLAQSGPTTGNQYTVVETPVGIILLVHPRINDDGNITMRVHPVVSTVTGLVNGLPQTSSREAETTVRVKDGDTLVIGGLIRDEDIRQIDKIPFLGDLPIIGNLFRNKNRQHRRTEVMVVLTIRLIK